MKKERKTTILLPAGEWQQSLLVTFASAGISYLRESERNYQVTFPDLGIEGVFVRTKSVPKLLASKNTQAVAGFTGTDILIQSRRTSLAEFENGWEVPLLKYDKSAPQPSVYLGTTPNARERFEKEPSLSDLAGGIIVSAYPELARQYFQNRGYDPEILQEDGKIEGLWRIIPSCFAICDISSSGKTMAENSITLFEIIMSVSLQLIVEEDKATSTDISRLETLKKLLKPSE